MKSLSNMRIGQRLAAGFTVVTGCLVAITALGYFGIQTLNGEITQLLNGDYKAVALANKAKAELWAKKALREDPNFAEAEEFLTSLGEA